MADLYTTILHKSEEKFEEKRSVFIGHALPVKTEDDALIFIKDLKKQYRDATHNVYAYVLGDGTVQRYSDDGEPQGTAGMPVLDVIRKNGCTDTVIVVTRYFGGILLGAGGLVRAYSHSAKLALEAAEIATFEKYAVMRLKCPYSDYGKYLTELEKLCAVMDETEFAENICLNFAIKETELPRLEKIITEISFGKLSAEKISERFDYR